MRALVVDDSRAARAILRRFLAERAFEVLEAPDAERARELLDAGPPPDLALVDWNLPGIDGLELVRRLRADRRFDRLRIVMVTTEVEPAQIEEALRAGADEYLMKPFTRETLESKLALVGLAGPRDG